MSKAVLKARTRGLVKRGLWTGLYAGFSAVATLAARRAAAVVWRRYMGEDPPTKK